MAEKKRYYWIKLKEDFFELETIDWLMSQKNGCEYIVLYQKLCLLTVNKSGKLESKIGEMIIPYDANKIARDTKFPIDTVIVAMELFKKIGLIYEQEDGVLRIPYVDEMVGSETSSAKRVREYRQKKALQCNTKCNNDVTQENRDKILEIDNREKIEDKDLENKRNSKINYQEIVDMYNETCVSFPQVVVVSENRKKAIKARLNNYTVEQLRTMFKKAEASDFLKGKNDRNWSANFDWLMKDSNTAKVLEGNYDNKVNTQTNSTPIQQNTYNENQKYIDAVNENQRFLEEMAAREMGLNK